MAQPVLKEGSREAEERIAVVDTDVHPTLTPADPEILDRLSARWREYIREFGFRDTSTERTIPPQRKFTHRVDALDPSGRPAYIPGFTRGQLLDEYDMSGAILNDTTAIQLLKGNGNFPAQLTSELCRAYNDAHAEVWMDDDPRFYSSLNIPIEDPGAAVEEISRCKEGPYGDRYVQVMTEPRSDHLIGNPRYWPVFEACEHYDVPFSFHTSPGRRMTASGGISYYFEWHCGIALRNFSFTPSLIFEGVFDRFPKLKVALIEQGWAWAVPFAWRMDASYEAMKKEVAHLERKPSEYLRDHFWFGTQPMVEPESKKEVKNVVGMFEDFFGKERLMFSSDYPHWDFDSPYEAISTSISEESRRKILGQNASDLYGIPLLENSGILTKNPATLAG